ncbi:MAG: U32 family peptidase [Candidatus Nanoarchaeia archaeon]|nr:U32 family peptidase [Candidatus Nanoarchaeia archaeon]
MKNKIELLLPAGSLGNLKAAVANGADSVYIGLDKFNARESATNFRGEYFKEAIKICKSNNVRVYLTMNTLIKNSEIKEFFKQLVYAYEQGIDAVIIQEPSFISIIKESFPDLFIHLSTQAGIMNSAHANIFKNIERIILARELNKEKLKCLRKNVNKELEVFIHGALCVSFSGSCLFSSFLGGRSGNRGKCAQPCRKIYNNCYYLSTKELCLIKKIPELIELGIDSLKIEGRMRTPYYVATVASIYRKAIDDYYKGDFKITDEIISKLKTAFSREFTEGSFSSESVFNKMKAHGSSAPEIKEYIVNTKDIKLEKRDYELKIPEIKTKQSKEKRLLVRVYNKSDAVLAAENGADIIYYDIFAKDFLETQKLISKPVYGVTPRIMFDSDIPKITDEIKNKNPSGILAGNLGMINLNLHLPIHLDYNCNCFNDIDLKFYEEKEAYPIISPELSINEQTEFKNKNFASFVHGKMRLMTIAHQLQEGWINDNKGRFKINKINNGVEILNERELGLFNKAKNLLKSGINNFYIDTDIKVGEITKIYRQILDGKTVDVSKIKQNYVLGWSEKGVL